MAEYHCFILNKEGGVSAQVDILTDADDDADAIRTAVDMIVLSEDLPAAEIWCCSQIVGRIPRQAA